MNVKWAKMLPSLHLSIAPGHTDSSQSSTHQSLSNMLSYRIYCKIKFCNLSYFLREAMSLSSFHLSLKGFCSSQQVRMSTLSHHGTLLFSGYLSSVISTELMSKPRSVRTGMCPRPGLRMHPASLDPWPGSKYSFIQGLGKEGSALASPQ